MQAREAEHARQAQKAEQLRQVLEREAAVKHAREASTAKRAREAADRLREEARQGVVDGPDYDTVIQCLREIIGDSPASAAGGVPMDQIQQMFNKFHFDSDSPIL